MVGWLVGSVLEEVIGGVGVVAALPGFFRLGVVDNETSMLAICNKTLIRTRNFCFLTIINSIAWFTVYGSSIETMHIINLDSIIY